MTTSAVKVEEYFFGKSKRNFLHAFSKTFKLQNKLLCPLAATLDKAEATSVWTPPEWEPNQRLAIRQLMLSHKAKANEFNVVEVSYHQIHIYLIE